MAIPMILYQKTPLAGNSTLAVAANSTLHVAKANTTRNLFLLTQPTAYTNQS